MKKASPKKNPVAEIAVLHLTRPNISILVVDEVHQIHQNVKGFLHDDIDRHVRRETHEKIVLETIRQIIHAGIGVIDVVTIVHALAVAHFHPEIVGVAPRNVGLLPLFKRNLTLRQLQ